MNSGIFKKNYMAIVDGILKNKCDTITLPIAREENSIIKRCVRPDGDIAITDYYVLKELSNMSLIYLTLKTGRTHQIRVHMSYLGHPIIGDSLYGTTSNLITRQALHACKVRFIHPIAKEHMNIEAPIPSDISQLIL